MQQHPASFKVVPLPGALPCTPTSATLDSVHPWSPSPMTPSEVDHGDACAHGNLSRSSTVSTRRIQTSTSACARDDRSLESSGGTQAAASSDSIASSSGGGGAAGREGSSVHRLAGLPVLYVDDEAVNRAVAQRMLRRLGCVPSVLEVCADSAELPKCTRALPRLAVMRAI